MRKSLLTVLAAITMVVIFCFGASALDASGQCGDNVYWDYNSTTKELVISGSGAMSYSDISPFYGSDIKSVVINSGVTTIGDDVFYDCIGLEYVYYAGTQTQWQNIVIGNNNSRLTDANIYYNYCHHINSTEKAQQNETCTEIGYTAGKYCPDCDKWLEGHKEIPATGHTDTNSDSWCDVCDEYCISELVKTGNCGLNVIYKWYKDGMLVISGSGAMTNYSYNNSPFYDSDIKSVVIKSSVTTIGLYAFSGCCNLISATIPDSVITIGSYAFQSCDSLQSIIIPDSVITLGSHAFIYCDSLKRVEVGNSVTAISYFAFAYCDSLKDVEIGNSVITIGDYAFYNCNSLKRAEIGNNVIAIGSYAFHDCDDLKSVIIGNSVTAIGYNAFSYCYTLTSVTIPDSVTSIDDDAFSYCNSLVIYCNKNSGAAQYAVDNSVDVVYLDGTDEENIFSGKVGKYTWKLDKRTGLLNLTGNGDMIDFDSVNAPWYDHRRYITAVNLPDGLTKIGAKAFESCRIKDITMPDSVTHIGSYAFASCNNLTSATIGNSVTTIGKSAFYDCDILTSVTIPDSVTTIGDSAFYFCDSLEKVYAADVESWLKINFSYSYSNPMYYAEELLFGGKLATDIVIPDSISYISDYAFYNCKSLTSIIFALDEKNNSEITSMPDISDTKVKEIILPASIEYIRNHVFPETIEKVTVYNPNCSFDSLCGLGYTHTIVGFKGSTAEAFAETIGAQFIDIETIHTHNYRFVGDKVVSCACGKKKTISLTLSATKYIYDGKNKTPKVTIKDSEGKVLTKNVDYKLTVASKRAGIGRYTVKVTFIGNYSGSKNLYFYILPGKPATVKSVSQGTTSNKLTWSEVPGAVGYTLYYYSNSKKAYKKINTTTNTTYTVKGLLTGTKYTFKIVAYGETASGKVYDSETYALLKSATKTKTPELTKVTASSTKGKAYVYHTNVKGETGYTVYYSTSSTTGFKKYANFKADTTRCDITKLTSGKTYYFKVRTYIKTDSGYVYSAWSNIKGVKVK